MLLLRYAVWKITPVFTIMWNTRAVTLEVNQTHSYIIIMTEHSMKSGFQQDSTLLHTWTWASSRSVEGARLSALEPCVSCPQQEQSLVSTGRPRARSTWHSTSSPFHSGRALSTLRNQAWGGTPFLLDWKWSQQKEKKKKNLVQMPG